MANSTDSVSQRIRAIQDRIVSACERCGRDSANVTLVAVSKRQPLERMRAAIQCGLRSFGENQIQEAVAKSSELDVDIDWHFIGILQSNKVKSAVRLFNTIHSLDRPKIIQRIEAECASLRRPMRGFLQVHLGEEDSKHGFPVAGLEEAVRPFASLEWLRVVGVMALPPYEEDLERARHWFQRLREIRDRLASRPEWSNFEGLLSMGMSHDFEVAIEEGATHVRVGSSLFGPRAGK